MRIKKSYSAIGSEHFPGSLNQILHQPPRTNSAKLIKEVPSQRHPTKKKMLQTPLDNVLKPKKTGSVLGQTEKNNSLIFSVKKPTNDPKHLCFLSSSNVCHLHHDAWRPPWTIPSSPSRCSASPITPAGCGWRTAWAPGRMPVFLACCTMIERKKTWTKQG